MDLSLMSSLLECSVCLDPLNASNRVLPCQHTFCTDCLRDVWTKRLNPNAPNQSATATAASQRLCPECRTPCPHPVDQLPSNVLLNRLLEGFKSNDNNTAGAAVGKDRAAEVGKLMAKVALEASPDKQAKENIPGNLSTNPFLAMMSPPPSSTPPAAGASAATPPVPPPFPARFLPPARDGSSAGASAVPTLPPKPGQANSPVTPGRPVKPAGAVGRTPSSSTLTGHQIYRAIFNYEPKKEDELGLTKGELYVVIEKCADGWFKGSCVNHLKTGVFPGNYVKHIKDGAVPVGGVPKTKSSSSLTSSPAKVLEPTKVTMPSSSSNRSLSSEVGRVNKRSGSPDLIDLTTDDDETFFISTSSNFKKPSEPSSSSAGLYNAKTNIVPPNVTAGWGTTTNQNNQNPPSTPNTPNNPTASSSTSGLPPPPVKPRERYRCVLAFPASTPYELELAVGEIVVMLKQRDDGWAKGTVEGTTRTGLFPITFVQKMAK